MSSDPKRKIRILIVDDIPEARENLKKLLAFEPDFDVVGTASTGREGLEMTRDMLPDIVLMDINMPDMDGITATDELRRTVPSCGVVMMSVQGEAEYLRRAMAAGAKDFLTKPPPAEELYATIRRVYEVQVQTFGPGGLMSVGPTSSSGKPKLQNLGRDTHIVVVYSPQGGAGKTTVATNLAASLMLREETKVLLMDLDLQFGDVGVFLNLKPQATILDLVKTVDDFDPDLVDNVLVTHDSGLRVLLAPVRPEEADLVPSDKVHLLIDKLKGMFDFIVIDVPSRLDDLTLGLFDTSERILLVVNPTLPSVKNTLAVMALMDSMEYPETKTQIVINRHTPELERTKVTIPVASIEQKLKRTAMAVIPMDERRVLYAVNRGISLIARDRNLSPAKELIALGSALQDSLQPKDETLQLAPPQPKAPSSRLSRLFGG